MADKRTAEVLLKYTIDNASANRVRQSFASLDSELEQLRSDLTGVGTAAQTGVSGLRQRFAQGETAVVSMQSEVEQLRAELLALDNVTVTPTVDVQSASGGSIRGNAALNTVDRFGRFGTQISGAFGQAGGIGNTLGLIGDVADSFGTLGIVGGAAALAVGALSIAVNDLKDSAEKAAAAAQAVIEGNRAAEAAGQMTAAERAARLAELLDTVKFEEQSIAARQAEIAANDAAFALAQYSNALGLTNTNLVYLGNDLTASSDRARASIDDSNLAITRAATEFINLTQQVNKFVDIAGKAGIELSGKVGKPADKTFTLGTGIADGMTPFQDSQAQLNAALQTTHTDAYLGAITKTIEAQQALTVAQNAYNEAVAASEARIGEINQRLTDALAEAESDRLSSLQEAEQRAGEDQVKAKEAYEARKAQIDKQFNRSHFNAVANRDALADKLAKDQYEDETDANKKNQSDQLKTINDGLKRQREAIEASYKKTVATAQAAASAAIRTEQQAAQARLNVLQQGVQAAQVALVNAQQAEYLTKANFYNQSVSQATVWANTMQLILSYGLSIPGGTGTPKMPTPIIGKWAGGNVYPGQTYVVGEKGPEIFQTAVPGRIIPNGAGTNINLNVSGATTETIKVVSRQQAISTFNRILDSIGVA